MQSVYIFKANVMLHQKDLQSIREELQRQIEDGVKLLNSAVSFVDRKLEECGHTINVELISTNTVEHQLFELMQMLGIQLYNPDGTIQTPEEIGKGIVTYLEQRQT